MVGTLGRCAARWFVRTNSPALAKLSEVTEVVIRGFGVQVAGGAPMAWALSHDELAVGLVAALPAPEGGATLAPLE
jgi:hypothetical protein